MSGPARWRRSRPATRATCRSTAIAGTPKAAPRTIDAVLRPTPRSRVSDSRSAGTSPPNSASSPWLAARSALAFCRKKPVALMSSSSASGGAAAKSAGVRYFSKRTRVTWLIWSSRACAARIVATSSSNGFENSRVGPQSGLALASRVRMRRARARSAGSGGLRAGFARVRPGTAEPYCRREDEPPAPSRGRSPKESRWRSSGGDQVGPGDEDAEGPAPHDHAPIAREVGVRRKLVVERSVRRLQRPQVEARSLSPLPAGLTREVDVNVRRVGDRHILEPHEPLPADVDDPHRSLAVVDGIDVAQLAHGEHARPRRGGRGDARLRGCTLLRRWDRGLRERLV